MAQALETSKLFSYLLGTMGESQKEDLEQAFFANDDQFELLLAAEDDLIDGYVRGSLSPADRQAFEKNFLTTPERRQRLEFARTLFTHVQANPPKVEARVPWWKAFFSFSPTAQLAMGAAVLALVILVSQALRVQQAPPAREQARVEEPTQNRPSPAPVESAPKPAPAETASSVLAFALSPGLTRDGGGAKTLEIPQVTRTVQLQLNLENADYQKYSVLLQTPEGEDVWKQNGLRSKGAGNAKAVFVDVPASLLSPRDYVVRVTGVNEAGASEDVAEYAFRTARK